MFRRRVMLSKRSRLCSRIVLGQLCEEGIKSHSENTSKRRATTCYFYALVE